MRLATLTEHMTNKYDDKTAIKMLHEAGFKYFDISFFKMRDDEDYEMNKDNYEEYIKDVRAYADSLGMVCIQSHAPFHSSCGDEEKDEITFQKIVRAIHGAAIMGADVIIVHPKQHLTYNEGNNPEILKEMNKEFYSRLIPYAKKYNIKIAIENMWHWFGGRIWHSTCSRQEEFKEYVDMMDSEWIVACLDIGHVALVDEGLPEMIEALGPRLKALHVHDNDFKNDQHLFPFLGKIDFNSVISSLAKIGYTGDLTFEADATFNNLPEELYGAGLKFLKEIGTYLVNDFSNKCK